MIEERDQLMVSQNSNQTQTLRKAHFLKPTLDPINQTLPKPPSSLSLSSKPNINLLKRRVNFKGTTIPQKNWDTWVQNLQQTHENTWKKVGIFDAIRASTCCIVRDNELILGLAYNWCTETNTFVFQWGECSITLEDVMILGGFSVLGECVKTPSQNKEIVKFGEKMFNDFLENRSNLKGPVGHYDWMNYFMEIGGELEHMAFLVLWLSRYVFSTDHYCRISQCVFPIAICLARGTRIALAPAVLASIYRDLSLLKDKIVGFLNEWVATKLVLWAPFQFVQLWVWERFPTLGPLPISLLDGEPRLARWRDLKKQKNESCVIHFELLGESVDSWF
ncbi:uncharacterized protein [Spinacia oleracea]|uniref:Aminotransferase-like plant mobile domain-containing protein n=1 Tax=Spinacia oleracea TaxID=3562 RepID=A0ABM3RRQ9_SPIOL|nr:uncharacterized protein LOC130471962 [Spinacia oleracea]